MNVNGLTMLLIPAPDISIRTTHDCSGFSRQCLSKCHATYFFSRMYSSPEAEFFFTSMYTGKYTEFIGKGSV